MFDQTIAIDWSGARDPGLAKKCIWTCSVSADGEIDLRNGRTREEIFNWLKDLRSEHDSILVGIDFAFSFPAWFVREHSDNSSHFWNVVAQNAETWLADCPEPFFGRPGKKARWPKNDYEGPLYRLTDRRGADKVMPASPLQIGGAGAVGTGTLRGIPFLSRLQDVGYKIWPFEAACLHTVVEIYPRWFTPHVIKGDPYARRGFLETKRAEHTLYELVSARQIEQAETDDNAFDALISAVEMRRRDAHCVLDIPASSRELLEGRVYRPPPREQSTPQLN